MKIGVIGTGNMGSTLAASILEGGQVKPDDIHLTNRTLRKAYKLKEQFPLVHIEEDAIGVVKKTDIIFICLRPLDIHKLLLKIRSSLKKEQLVVSITSPISVAQLESLVPCQAARLIPSITNRSLSGNTLVTFGVSCSVARGKDLMRVAESFSQPILINEEDTRVASDIASCGPAFISDLLERMTDAAVRQTSIDKKQAELLAEGMLTGLGRLLEKKYFTLKTLKEKVRVKGGVTGAGLEIFEKETGDMFDHLFQRTQEKFKEDKALTDKQFSEKKI